MALAACTLIGGCGYGEINALEERVGASWHTIEVQLQRRSELVPSLVETVRAYGAVGEELLSSVADARARLVGAVRSADMSEMEAANVELCAGLSEILEQVEDLQELQSDPGFRLLQSQLGETQEEMVAAGREYNEAVGRYNDYIIRFPQLVTAKMIGAEVRETFEFDQAAAATSPRE
jgi:LemA protein